MYVVYVHDAKIAKENGFTLQFCSNYPPKMSIIVAMYTFLTNYNTIRKRFSPNERKSKRGLVFFQSWRDKAINDERCEVESPYYFPVNKRSAPLKFYKWDATDYNTNYYILALQRL